MKNIFVAAIVMALVMPRTVPADDEISQLGSDTHYYLAVSQDHRKASWLLAWEGTIQGGLTGVIRWWGMIQLKPYHRITLHDGRSWTARCLIRAPVRTIQL